jgi:undecaprenyl-diphosphatase
MLSVLHATILGLIEGLTEFLPVSSTGHLILVDRALGNSGPAVEAFEIVIQLGALLACMLYYRVVLARALAGFARGDAGSRRLLIAIAAAFVPTALAGFLFHKRIEAALFGPIPVGIALIAGGILMIAVDLATRRRPEPVDSVEQVSAGRGFLVGCVQCAALWPGTSRSMASMVGGKLGGLSTRAAADFAFLVGIPTLGAACLFKLVHARHVLMHEIGPASLAVGLGVSFVVGWVVIAAFLRFLKQTGLVPFGVYRVVIGAVVLFALR